MEENKEKLDEYEQAAVMFRQFSKDFRKIAYQLNDRKKNAAVRVLEKVIFEPLEDVNLIGKEEQKIFDICQKVLYCRVKLIEYAQKRHEESKGESNE
jgi:hypothetical protein